MCFVLGMGKVLLLVGKRVYTITIYPEKFAKGRCVHMTGPAFSPQCSVGYLNTRSQNMHFLPLISKTLSLGCLGTADNSLGVVSAFLGLISAV